MAVRGTKPKPEGQARNRNAPVHEWTEVPNVPFETGPKLPKREGGRVWSSWSKRKWIAWSRMPHCALWSDADWDFAYDALELHARFLEGSTPAATELRNREKQMGTTADFRRDLRIRYVDPAAQKAPATVTSLDDFRGV